MNDLEIKCPKCGFEQFIYSKEVNQLCPKCDNYFIFNNVEIYTDGAYSSNRNQGGIGFVIYKDDKEIFTYGKTFKNTTSQRMELLACIIAIESVKIPSIIKIISDSQYLVKTMTDNWKRNKNLDLWKRLEDAINKHIKIYFEWVKGHEDCSGNQKADYLSNRHSRI